MYFKYVFQLLVFQLLHNTVLLLTRHMSVMGESEPQAIV